MIRIAYVMDTLYSPAGGTEKQLLMLLRHLDRSRFDPVLCVFRKSKWLESDFHECPLHVIGIRALKNPATLRRTWELVRFLKQRRIHIVQTFFKDGNKVGIVAAKLAGVETIISSRRTQGFWSRSDLVILRLLAPWVDLVVTNSYSTQRWVQENEGLPLSRIRVLYNGLDLTPYRLEPGSRAGYRRLLGIPDGAPAIGIVANLRPVKGYEVFLRAAQLVHAEIPEARFVVVGEGPLESPLQKLAAGLGLAERVHFLGRRDDVIRILSALDIGVISSHCESFPNALVEYMAAGLPVVCTEVGGARESVEEGANGFVVPVGDHRLMAARLVEIIRAEAFERLGAVSRSRAEKLFSRSEMVRSYEEIYASSSRRGRESPAGRSAHKKENGCESRSPHGLDRGG